MIRPSTGHGPEPVASIQRNKPLTSALAPPRHPLLRLWLVGTLGLVMTMAGAAFWWEKQLPGKLRDAAEAENFEACLRFSEQLAALQWLGQSNPEEQALCRRRMAQRLWGRGDTAGALKLQRQLVQSDRGTAKQRQTDRDTLAIWQQRLRDQALALFRDGELDAAVALLSPLEGQASGRGGGLSDTLRETWNRNRVDYVRVQELIQAERWWEALDNLNRLDHPWWQAHAAPAQEKVLAAIERLRETQEHHQHGESSPDVIGGALLDGEVQRHLQDGLEPWDAFEQACASLGGAVAEDGPESFCQRQQPGGS